MQVRGAHVFVCACVCSESYSCGLRPTGDVLCWCALLALLALHQFLTAPVLTFVLGCRGLSTSGQLDAVPGPFTQITAGQKFAAGVRTDGTVAFWGEFTRAVGAVTSIFRTTECLQTAASYAQSCCLRKDQTVLCWGTDPVLSEIAATPPSGQFSEIRAGDHHFCGIRCVRVAFCRSL